MISSMRNNRKILAIILWLVIAAFVATIFVVWGIGSRDNQMTYAAKVGDKVIGYDEFRTRYDNTVFNLRQAYGNDYEDYIKDADLEKLTLQELINEKLLLTEAERLGIPATDGELVAYISSVPAFQENGVFAPERYVQVLAYQRITPEIFENSLREEIRVNKLKNLISNSAYVVTNEEAALEFDYRWTSATASYFGVPASSFETAAAPSEDNLSAYYNVNKHKYRVPASVKLKYIVFDKNNFTEDNVSVSDEEIENYYASNAASYSVPESVIIRNIIVNVPNWNDADSVKKAEDKINMALAALDNGSGFEQAAAAYSDPALSAEGGLIGRVYKGQLQPDIERDVFALEKGAHTRPLKTSYGFTIIKADEKFPAKTFTLDEKRNEIAGKIKSDKLDSSFRNHVLSIYKEILKAGNITAYKEAFPSAGPIVYSTELFSENEAGLPVLATLPAVKKSIFALPKTELSQLTEDGDLTYLFEVEEKIASRIPPLEEVKAAVTLDYGKDLAEKSALTAVAESLKQNGFDKTAERYKAPIERTAEFNRFSPVGPFSSDPLAIEAIFKGTSGETLPNVYLSGGKVYAVRVDTLIPPSRDKFAEEKDAIISYIRSVKTTEALASFISALESRTSVEINPSFLSSGQLEG